MKAELPGNEKERLEALRQTGLLDTRPEDEFDSLARIASVICDTPMASITLVDERRQWFKANIGSEATETPRDVAFCSHTILQEDLFIVEDATLDPRFSDNPLVTGEPKIRFYAGAPLTTADGFHLGTLCVIDRLPRRLTQVQCEALTLLARQVNKQINLRRQQKALQSAIDRSSLVEQSLRASEGLFHAFMDNAPFLGFMKDAQGRMVYYNQQLADHYGIDREAWLGKDDEALWPAEASHALRENDQTVLRNWKMLIVEETAQPARGESPERSAQAVKRWRSYKFPFRDAQGREYVAGFAVDITADKLAQQQIGSYQAALEAANAKLESLAVTDLLTELPNRRAFEAALEREFSSARRYDRPLALIILDIDDFRFFNEKFGRGDGDHLLRSLAALISGSVRSTDFVARYGAEEFAIILPNSSKQTAMESAERLRLAIAGDEDKAERPVTVSIGVTTLESSRWTMAEFAGHADDALLKAKRAGKNRVRLA